MGEQVIRGRLMCPHERERAWTLIEDGALVIDAQGRIERVVDLGEAGVDDAAAQGYRALPETCPGAVWMPGFVDTHIHFPQTMILGSASGELLPWLERSVFPEEGKFADVAYAEGVARTFCEAMAEQGTTCASIFSSSHPGATEILFRELERRGMRGDVGLTLMNRGAPAGLLRDTAEAMAASETLVTTWHNADGGRLRFRVTPRFALSCTAELMAAAGALAERHGLPIQTHISENPHEITATLEVFPEATDYLNVYERFGLVGERSLFAHGVWLKPREWDALAHAQCSVAHCPDSNFFLGSGPMPLKEARARDLKLGLGTDIGAGRSFSLRRCCSRAYDASRLTDSTTDAAELLWDATRGGAVALGRGDQIGLLTPGLDADLVAIVPPVTTPELPLATLCEHLVFREDHHGVVETRVRGKVVWTSPPLR